MPRLVVPGYPHHVTQRGNRSQRTFFSENDYQTYIELLAAARDEAGVEILAYCLMPNHVHLVVIPQHKVSLANLFKEAHRRYTRRINLAHDWRGHLWQERFHSFVMDERHLVSCVRYVELNPVNAGLCSDARSWSWSSVRAHLQGSDDRLVTVKPMLDRIGNWTDYLQCNDDECTVETIRGLSRTGRPGGSDDFIRHLEALTGRTLRKKRAGRKPSRYFKGNR